MIRLDQQSACRASFRTPDGLTFPWSQLAERVVRAFRQVRAGKWRKLGSVPQREDADSGPTN